MHYLLIYDVASDYMTRRAAFRDAHLKLAWQAAERGELVLGGAVGDPVESSILLFQCASPEVPAAFAKADPYVLNGVAVRWRVQPWNTVVGQDCTNPVKVG
ncbi:MAG TPA: YciI-like protein [Holophaga sp.]|nr:YciI-like protein [Holophaga sp.]